MDTLIIYIALLYMHNVYDHRCMLPSLQFPRLCDFQKAEYSYSLSLAETNSLPEVTSETKTYDGSDDRELEGQLLGLKLEIGPIYRVRVRAEVTETGEVFGDSAICIEPGTFYDTYSVYVRICENEPLH